MHEHRLIQGLRRCEDLNSQMGAIEKMVDHLDDDQVREQLCLTALMTDYNEVRERIVRELKFYARKSNHIQIQSASPPWELVYLCLSGRQPADAAVDRLIAVFNLFYRHRFSCLKTGFRCIWEKLENRKMQSSQFKAAENLEP